MSLRMDGEGSTLSDGFQLGDWLVYPSLNELRSGADLVRLEPKAMALLVYLARRAGQSVSREELLSEVWPGVIVSDDALTQVVIKLRKALGDSARASLYIQTIPKRGYRLVAEVEGTAFEPTPVPLASSAGKRGRSRTLAAALALLLLGLVVVGYLAFQDRRPEQGGREPAYVSADTEKQANGEALTIAVLPFETLSEGPQQENFARGITADLTTDLSKLSSLAVISVHSVFGHDRGGAREIPAAVRYLVSGSVQRTADRLELHVRLTDSSTGRQLWSQRFDRPYQDLFDVQVEISRQVVDILAVKVSEAEHRRLAKPYTRNLEAYEYFLRGQADLLVRRQPQNLRARQMYRQAIDLDPTFARAYAGLALSHVADYRNRWSEDGAASLERASVLAETALEIDPGIPEIYWVLGYIDTQRRRHDQAIGRLEQALELDSSFADAYALMGGIHTYIGKPARSIQLLRNAMRLNPSAGYLYFLLLGRAYYFLDDPQQAIINLHQALARNPANLEAHVYLAAASLAAGEREEAEWEVDEIRSIDSAFTPGAWLQTYPMTDPVQSARLSADLESLGL